MPGSSPTIERRLRVILLKSVLLPTLGRPTIATRGKCAAPARAGTTDLRYVGKIFSCGVFPRRANPAAAQSLEPAHDSDIKPHEIPLLVYVHASQGPPAPAALRSIKPCLLYTSATDPSHLVKKMLEVHN